MNNKKFELNDKEQEAYEKWYKKIPKKHREKVCVNFTFTPTGIGDAISVSLGPNKLFEKDITDVSCW